MIQSIKDRIPTNVLSNDAIRYGIYDEQGKLLRYEYIKREDEPIEEGTPVNRALFLGMYENDISPIGIIKSFSNQKEREGFLLCDGSRITNIDYPSLVGKIKNAPDLWEQGDDPSSNNDSSKRLFALNNLIFLTPVASYSGQSNNTYVSSDNGFTFVQAIGLFNYPIQDMTFDGTYYLAIQRYGSSYNIARSLDGYTWELGASHYFYGVSIATNKKGTTVITGDDAETYYTTDNGSTLKSASGISTSSAYTNPQIIYMNGKFYLFIRNNSANTIYSSVDGQTFTRVEDTLSTDFSTYFRYGAYAKFCDRYYVAQGNYLYWTNDLSVADESIYLFSDNVGTATISIDEEQKKIYIKKNGIARMHAVDISNPDNPKYIQAFDADADDIDDYGFVFDKGVGTAVSSTRKLLHYNSQYYYMILPALKDTDNQSYGYIKY